MHWTEEFYVEPKAIDVDIMIKALEKSKAFLVGAEGVEPPTLCL